MAASPRQASDEQGDCPGECEGVAGEDVGGPVCAVDDAEGSDAEDQPFLPMSCETLVTLLLLSPDMDVGLSSGHG